MTWKRAKNTKEKLLTPRPCLHCGQFMSKEFLQQKYDLRGKKISDSLKTTQLNGGLIGRTLTPEDKILDLRRSGYSYRAIYFELGHALSTIRRICKKAGLNKIALSKDGAGIGRSSDTSGYRPWLELEK